MGRCWPALRAASGEFTLLWRSKALALCGATCFNVVIFRLVGDLITNTYNNKVKKSNMNSDSCFVSIWWQRFVIAGFFLETTLWAHSPITVQAVAFSHTWTFSEPRVNVVYLHISVGPLTHTIQQRRHILKMDVHSCFKFHDTCFKMNMDVPLAFIPPLIFISHHGGTTYIQMAILVS